MSEKASKGSSYLEIKLFDEKGPLGDNVIKNLARNIYLISPQQKFTVNLSYEIRIHVGEYSPFYI